MNRYNVKLVHNKYGNGIIAQVRELRSLFSDPHANRIVAGLAWTKSVCDEMRTTGEATIELDPVDYAVFRYNLDKALTMEFNVGDTTIPTPAPKTFYLETAI